MSLDDDAMKMYDAFHDEIIEFRQKDRFEEARLSVKSKSLGMVMRVASVICLLRSSLKDNVSITVTKTDFAMANVIVQSSVSTAFAMLYDGMQSSSKGSKKVPLRHKPLPEAENLTVEYLVLFHQKVRKIVCQDKILMSSITTDKIYPVVNNESGSVVANKFVQGLQNLGFGKYSPNSKSFKRFRPNDENCPDRENLKKKYRQLNIELTD